MRDKVTASRWQFIKHYHARVWSAWLLLMIMLPLTVAMTQLTPWYMAKVVELVSHGNPQEVWFEVLKYFAVAVTLSLLAPVMEYLTMLVLQYRVISPVSLGIRVDLFEKLLQREPYFWQRFTAGDLMTKIEQCRRSIAAYSSLGSFCYGIYMPLCGLAIMLFLLARISLLFAALTFVGLLICFALFYRTAQGVKQTANTVERMYAELFGRTVGKINHFFLIKIFGTAERETRQLGQEVDELNKMSNLDVWLRKKNRAVLGLCALLFFIVLMVYAVYLWGHQQISVGDVVYIFTVIGGGLFGIVQNMMDVFSGLMYNQSLLGENLKLFHQPPQITDTADARALRTKLQTVEIKNLSFAYENGEQVLHDLNLQIKAGEKIGLVGVSGGGKTTLLHLLLRLENTPHGCIFINGRDITELPQENLHRLMSFIPQDTSLFHRSIADNMAYGTFKATAKQIKAAAKTAYLADFIETLPQKYETLVGDKGIKLSGGQRQRVAIARAVLQDSPILLLDEATSALDSESERYIQQALKELIKDKTVIAAAHRLSTLKDMDRIIVMDKGRIIEDDTPQNLLKSDGKFAKLWNIQMQVEE